MKVLFATYPMAFHTPGGGEIQLLAYRKHLQTYGVNVTLFDCWNPRFFEHDIVHFFSCVGGSIHFCNFVKQLGLPLVISSSLWITEDNCHLYPVDEIRTQLNLADRIVTNSNMESDTISQVLSLPREKFFTVYNGFDEFFLKDIGGDLFRRTYGIEGKYVLNIGNIEPRKNQLMLVRAMKSFPDIRLVLIGHKRDRVYAEQVLSEGGNQINYIGPLPQGDMMLSAYQACELFCLPSTLETPGLAALEASAQGAPLLVTSEGSCAEYFGDSAIYVNPKSLDSLREKLNLILHNKCPKNYKAASLFRPELFTWTKTIKALSDTYRTLA